MGFFANLWNGIKNTASNIWNRGKEIVGNVWSKVSPVLRAIPVVGNLAANAVEGVANKVNQAGELAGHLASGRWKEAGKGVLRMGVDALGKRIPLIGGALADKFNEHVVDKLKRGGSVHRKPSATNRFQRAE